jgi:mono/diheme cytochrome c family protein
MRRSSVLLVLAGAVFAAASVSVVADRDAVPALAQSTAATPASAGDATTYQGFVTKYCATCHNDNLRMGGFSLQGLQIADAPAHADTWEKVIRMVRGGMMPPQGMPRPDGQTIDGFIHWLEDTIDTHAMANLDPGLKPIHRLNRTEYGNAILDLLDLPIDVAEFLPADDESHGFDNIAGVLRVSPSLLEQYLTAARKISSLAVGSDTEFVTLPYRVPPDDSQAEHVDGLPLGTRGGMMFTHVFPQDGEYGFSVVLLRNIVGYVTGLEFAHQLEILIDGERVFAAQVGGEEDNLASDENMSLAAEMLEDRLKARVHVAAGPRQVGVTFVQRNAAVSDEPLQLHERHHDLQDMNGLPLVDYMTISGPFDVSGPGDTPSRARIFSCRPGSAAEEAACARDILSTLARRAFRGPVSDADLQPILRLYEQGRAAGNFETGIEHGLRLILASPKFLFRTEAPVANGMARVSDLELASRLSFFFWSSVPDDDLLALAEQGRLSDRSVLEAQVRRMLADPKSSRLVENFAGQWLMLRNLRGHVPNPGDFPNFDNELRQAFRQETELFFESIIREDRNVLDLLTADYTFVNERLARHYGIRNVAGSHFRRVHVEQDERRGLLGHGSILTVTSYPNRTSPVLRGHFILENILGTPPPPPPPNVPDLEDNKRGEPPRSLRERLELHRQSPSCAGCHRAMDPIGFALENFDGVGQWRIKEPGGLIDPSGVLTDGTEVDGPVALREALLRRPEMFVHTLTEKLMTYGLGRGVEYHDMPFIRAIERAAAADDYRFTSIVLGIVTSTPFQMKKTQGEDGSAVAAIASH